MTEAQKVTIESKAMLIESEIFSDLMYAIDRNKRGLWLIHKDTVIHINSDNIGSLLDEIKAVWEHIGGTNDY